MKSLNEDLKTGEFKKVYLLYGEEGYLKKQYKDKLIKAIFPLQVKLLLKACPSPKALVVW